MPKPTLEQRVAALEEQVRAIVAGQVGSGKRVKDWRLTAGAFTGDDVMKEIFAEGRKIREAERKRARSAVRSKRKAAS
jgi:hypothetical protein